MKTSKKLPIHNAIAETYSAVEETHFAGCWDAVLRVYLQAGTFYRVQSAIGYDLMSRVELKLMDNNLSGTAHVEFDRDEIRICIKTKNGTQKEAESYILILDAVSDSIL